MMKKFSLISLLILLLLTPVGVLAHAELRSAVPPPGAKLTEQPQEIRLTFSEAIGQGSTITIYRESFQEVEGIETAFNPDRPEEMFTAVPGLEPGTYSVNWIVMSLDGHPASGSYTFELLPKLASGYTAGVIIGTVAALIALGLGAWAIRRWVGNKS